MNFKRVFDVTAAAAALIVLSPVLAAAAIASTVKFGASPFYCVDRAGKDGKPFRMIKFRSMSEESEHLQDEERLSAYGSFLRKTSIDELPQLINILRGDMSFVGPRPRTADLRGGDFIPEQYRGILDVRPGLTGAWQIASIGRQQRISPEEKLELELNYVRSNPGLAADAEILLKTIPAVFRGHDGEVFGNKPKG